MRKSSTLCATLLGVGSLFLGTAADANPVTWTLNGVTFSDGGTASGSFVFDADTGAYTGIEIATAGGALLPGATYTALDDFSAPRDFGFGANVAGLFAIGNFVLDINGLSSFTNAGGTVTIGNVGGFQSAEGICATAGCSLFNPVRGAVAGTLVGSAAPEPTSWAILFLGFGGLGAMMRRRRAKVAIATA